MAAGARTGCPKRTARSCPHDLQAIHCWLAEFEGSPQTVRNYRKGGRALTAVGDHPTPQAALGLLREDFQAYQAFLTDPQPSSYWCGPERRGIHCNGDPFRPIGAE